MCIGALWKKRFAEQDKRQAIRFQLSQEVHEMLERRPMRSSFQQRIASNFRCLASESRRSSSGLRSFARVHVFAGKPDRKSRFG